MTRQEAERIAGVTLDDELFNQGKGTVYENEQRAEKLVLLLMERPHFNYELNALLGWQFSQATFTARKAGFNIRVYRVKGCPGLFLSVLEDGVYVPKSQPRQQSVSRHRDDAALVSNAMCGSA
jgi:hypothetical protein